MSLLVVVTLGFVGIEGLECYWDIRVVGDEEVVGVVDVDLIAKGEGKDEEQLEVSIVGAEMSAGGDCVGAALVLPCVVLF